MKRVLSIFIALCVATVVVASSVVPHHHHSDHDICFAHHDEHEHEQDHKAEHSGDDCPLDHQIEASLQLNAAHSNKCAVCADHSHHHDHQDSFVPLLAYIGSAGLAVDIYSADWSYNSPALPYFYSRTIIGSPLRAPPIA